MPDLQVSDRFLSTSPDQTCAFAQRLAPRLSGGDTLLLNGPIGAGKSHFARCMIQSLLGRAEDVPSPTFTLVQTYEADDVEIWHSDLYRLTDPDEVVELGLAEAFETAICLVEWPDALTDLTPGNALTLCFEPSVTELESRLIRWSYKDRKWASRLAGTVP